MILHAITLGARDLVIGIGLAFFPSLAVATLVFAVGKLEQRAERRHVAAVERECERRRAQLRMHERHRTEMRSYNARPTAAERWGGRAA